MIHFRGPRKPAIPKVAEETADRIYRYGWIPDLPDHRDARYNSLPVLRANALPPELDLRYMMPPVWQQAQLGACTANACGSLCWSIDKTAPFEPSRLFIYYNTRQLEGTVRTDSGASIRDAIKSVVRWGFCPESLWPYDVSKFAVRPPQAAYDAAKRELVTQYTRVSQRSQDIKASLVAGFPVEFGFSVYESFESNQVAQTGKMPMPSRRERILGGHAVLIVGWRDKDRVYIIRNSWGEDWGDKGYFYMPYDFAHNPNQASDFWNITAVP
jgi:C1A family cysteine protease